MEKTKTLWLPEQASTFSGMVDWAFNLYLWISVFFFVVIVALMAVFVVKYRRRRPDQLAEAQIIHNTVLETTWTVIPLLLVMWFFVIGIKGYWHMRVAPSNAMLVEVVARKWSWGFQYPQGPGNDTLVVPVHQPVRLRMTSTDVIHSFSIPAFRTKADVIPGRYHSLWFEATKTGVFPVLCTQYCGAKHSEMWTAVKVVEPAAFKQWLVDAADPSKGKTPEEFGAIVYSKRGCNACHKLDGEKSIGPSWKGIWGKNEAMTDGKSLAVDAEYLKRAIVDPAAEIVAGYQPVMPVYKGVLSDKEIDAVIAYIRTLK